MYVCISFSVGMFAVCICGYVQYVYIQVVCKYACV